MGGGGTGLAAVTAIYTIAKACYRSADIVAIQEQIRSDQALETVEKELAERADEIKNLEKNIKDSEAKKSIEWNKYCDLNRQVLDYPSNPEDPIPTTSITTDECIVYASVVDTPWTFFNENTDAINPSAPPYDESKSMEHNGI